MYLGEMFDEFLQKNKKATIDNSIHNITECFFDGKSYQTPQNWGKIDGKRKIVLSYIVKDGLLVSKFKKNTQGKFKQQNDKYAIKKPDLDFKVMSCLCLKPIRNTSFHEVYEVMQKENLEHFFGFYRQNLENIKNSLANFEPEKDSLFVFAGDIQIVKKRLQLQKTWLKQILESGKTTLKTMEPEEYNLIKYLFPKKSLENPEELKKFSYMYGKPHHTKESEEFLSKKTNLFHCHA